MKKLTTVLIALGFIASASAQIKVSETAKERASMPDVRFPNTEILNAQDEFKTTAATAYDTLAVQAFYSDCAREGSWWGLWSVYPSGINSMQEIQASSTPMGSNAWDIRINAHFHTSILDDGFDTYKSLSGVVTGEKVVVSALVLLGRIGSPDASINDVDMPFFVQARNVVSEPHYADLSEQTAVLDYRVASTIITTSDTIGFPVTGFKDFNGQMGLDSKWQSLTFKEPFGAGKDFAVELGFPKKPNSKDSSWNAMTIYWKNGCYGYDADGTSWSLYSAYFFGDDAAVPFNKTSKREFQALPETGGSHPQYEAGQDEYRINLPFSNLFNDGGVKMNVNIGVKVVVRDQGVDIEGVDHLNGQATVYPIPAKRDVNINSAIEMRNIQIFNLAGQMVKEYKNVNDLVFSFDVTSFKSGMYIANITTDKGLISKKITVQ